MTTDFIRLGYNLIDHTRGAEAYKERFTNNTSQNYRITIFGQANDYRISRLRRAIRQSAPVCKLIENRKIALLKTKIAAYRAQYGTGYILKALWSKAVSFFYEHKTMLIFEHTKPLLPSSDIPPEITIETLGEDQIDIIASFLGIERDSHKLDVIMKRFANGGECFVARHNGTVAAIACGASQRRLSVRCRKALRTRRRSGGTFRCLYFPAFPWTGPAPDVD